jgi:glycosyltransferase involved in cell wall biosynthesis
VKILYHHRINSKDGQYVHIQGLTNALRDQGHEIIVVGPRRLETLNCGTETPLAGYFRRYLPQLIYELLELSYSVWAYTRLAKAVKKYRPDALYERYNLYCPSAVWVKRKYKLPLLLEVNAPLYEERKKYNGIAIDRLAQWTEHFVWRGADYLLPVTHVLARRLKKAGVDESKILVVPNAIDPERFRAIPTTEDAKVALNLQSHFVLGFVGFMRDWHGLERAINFIAEREEKNYHLLLVGDGPARTPLEREATTRGIADKITITGVVSRDALPGYIAAFDVALQPGVVEYASPLKLFEYLAAGRVIVAPKTRNIEEVLKDGENALLFRPDDLANFSEVLDRACTDEGLRRRVSQGARETIAKRGLTWENNAAKVVSLVSKYRHCS